MKFIRRAWVNHKTTIGGMIGAVGVTLTASSDPKSHVAGIVLNAVSLIIVGGAARDADVSTEQSR